MNCIFKHASFPQSVFIVYMVGTSVPKCSSILVKQELLWTSPFFEASHLLEKCVARQVKDGAHLKRKCSM